MSVSPVSAISSVTIRSALPADARAIRALVDPFAAERILLARELVGYYEAIQEFVVADAGGAAGAAAAGGARADGADGDGAVLAAAGDAAAGREGGASAPLRLAARVPESPGVAAQTHGALGVVGCGALHVLWEDLAEIRTLAVDRSWQGRGVGHALVAELLGRARAMGLPRVFCLTFEVDFFARQGFRAIDGTPVSPEVFSQLLRSHDDGVAEFLDLARVKPNTLGNTRMLIEF